MKKRRNFVNAAEYNLLNRLARKTGMDCWFCIEGHIITENPGLGLETDKCYHKVYDVENNKEISLQKGMEMFVDGLNREDLQQLTPQEREIFYRLCDDINIQIPKDLFVY